jgi:hypothetical protein
MSNLECISLIITSLVQPVDMCHKKLEDLCRTKLVNYVLEAV